VKNFKAILLAPALMLVTACAGSIGGGAPTVQLNLSPVTAACTAAQSDAVVARNLMGASQFQTKNRRDPVKITCNAPGYEMSTMDVPGFALASGGRDGRPIAISMRLSPTDQAPDAQADCHFGDHVVVMRIKDCQNTAGAKLGQIYAAPFAPQLALNDVNPYFGHVAFREADGAPVALSGLAQMLTAY
jgi:hypothetical protein